VSVARAALAPLAAILGLSTAARADIAVTVENPNPRGVVDRFEVYDMVCDRPLETLALSGRSSDMIEVCGSIARRGQIRIRYLGAAEWQAYPDLTASSTLELPPRPRSVRAAPARPAD
jgi:hypothetical protein